MILSVTLETNALGIVSRDHYNVSPLDLDKGVYVNSLFPGSYREYVNSIHVQSVDGGAAVQVTSRYGSKKYPSNKKNSWSSGEIGLSYASCRVNIVLLPEMMPTWDILTVTHQGATEVFQREEVVEGCNLGVIHPRMDGSLIPWLDIKVESVSHFVVVLHKEKNIYLVVGREPVKEGEETYDLRSFSTLLCEWDYIEGKPVMLIIDTQDLADSSEDADAAFRVAEAIEEQQPEMLEIVAKYMEYAADLGSAEALAWLRDYHEVDDSRYHPYV